MTTKQKGFTLIELLVVIAIIGILAALVLVSLGNARSKAQDARIKSDIAQMRTLAEIHYDSAGNYTNFGACVTAQGANCAGGTAASMASLEADMNTASGGAVLGFSDADEYCIISPLASSVADDVCVDSTGRTETGTPSCAAGVFAC